MIFSVVQAMVEDLLANFPTTCVLRVRMPISDDLSHRNFITKIVKYDRVVNVPNSMTCLTEMLPVSVIMAERKLTGLFINAEKLLQCQVDMIILDDITCHHSFSNILISLYVVINYYHTLRFDHSIFPYSYLKCIRYLQLLQSRCYLSQRGPGSVQETHRSKLRLH